MFNMLKDLNVLQGCGSSLGIDYVSSFSFFFWKNSNVYGITCKGNYLDYEIFLST